MTPVADIIKQAFRESNLIAVSASPTTPESNEAFDRLRSLVASVYGTDVGEKLEDWMVGSYGVTAPYHSHWTELQWKFPIQNSRIILNHTSPQTLYWTPTPDNGAIMRIIDKNDMLGTYPVTLNGEGRNIQGSNTLVLNTPGLNAAWIFDAETSNWKPLEGIDPLGIMPFPVQFDDYFIIKLAARLNPRYGRSLSDLSLLRLQEMEQELAAEYRQTRPMPAPLAVRRLSDPRNRYYNTTRRGRWGWMA